MKDTIKPKNGIIEFFEAIKCEGFLIKGVDVIGILGEDFITKVNSLREIEVFVGLKGLG